MTDDRSSDDDTALNTHQQTLTEMIDAGGCAEAWSATSELRTDSDEPAATSRRNVLRGIAFGSAAMVPLSAVDIPVPDGQTLQVPEDVRAQLSMYAEDMDAIREEFARHASDTLSDLSDQGILTEADPEAIATLSVDGDPLATDTPVHVDLLGVSQDSYFDEPMVVLTATHPIDGTQLDVTLIPEQGQSHAYLNSEQLDSNGVAQVSSTGWCDGELVRVDQECGFTQCQECSGWWPFRTFKTWRYWVRVYDEPDGKCSESFRDTCFCNYSC